MHKYTLTWITLSLILSAGRSKTVVLNLVKTAFQSPV